MSLFFPFIAILSVRQPTGSNSRSAEKGFFFALLKNGITDVSLFASYCCFIQEARHRLRKKEINLLAQQTICLRTLNEQTLMRKSLCVYGRKFQSSSLGVCCLNEILCAPSFGGGLHQRFTFFSAVHILLSITAFLTNSLILVALHKESSHHTPSKLLYRSLATTDLLVGLVAHARVLKPMYYVK